MNKKNLIVKLTSIAVLSALGTVLMVLVQIPYPFAPFLIIEISDVVVLISFMLFGFKGSLLVALFKTLGDLIYRGPVGPYGIGQITALIASLSYVLLFWIVNKLFKKNNILQMVLKYLIIILGITFIMTLANYLVLTPIFLGKFSFIDMSNDSLKDITGINSYLLSIIILYCPFNLIKSALVSFVSISSEKIILKRNNCLEEKQNV